MTPGERKRCAKAAVAAIVFDLSDRRGLRHEWDQIDRDIRDEIERTWREMVAKAFDDGSEKGRGR